MPKANWGISASDVDDFDRESQYKPYTGPQPPLAVYNWRIKVLKSVSGTQKKLPQLRVGLELEPRGASEDKYSGYFIMAFLPVGETTKFRYVPFLDAIGVSGKEFTNGTLTDSEGNVKKIGRWRNTGDEVIAAQLRMGEDESGNPKEEIGWMGEAVADFDDDEESDDFDDEDLEYDEDGEDGDYDYDDDDEDGE